MIASRRKLNEQIQLHYSQFLKKNGFNDNIDTRLINEVLDQSISGRVKMQTVEHFNAGFKELPSVNLIEYTNLPVSANSVTLPVNPIDLPLDMGVWSVFNATEDFIPISNTHKSTMKGTVAAFLENQNGYYKIGRKLNFIKLQTEAVSVILLSNDFSLLGEEDLIPLSPELQIEIINEVLSLISNGRFSQTELNNKDNNAN